MTAERAGGEGEFVCRMDGSALDDWQRKGKRGRDDVLCGNEARAEDEVEGRKRLLKPRPAQPRRRTRRNVNSTRRGYCYDLRRTTSATTATAFHCTRWVVVVVPPPRALLAPPTFPSASRAFLTPSPYIYLSPSLPSPSLSLTRHAAPAKPHRYRILPSVPPTPRPPPRREGYRAPSEDRRSC